jgi:hypothetical protein
LTVLAGVVVAFGGAFIYDRYQSAHPPEKSEDEDAKQTPDLMTIPAPDSTTESVQSED